MNRYRFRYGPPAMVAASMLSATPAWCADKFLRLSAYEPSYLIYRHATGDDNALRAHFSFKYSLLQETDPDPNKPAVLCNRACDVFFKYTGEFDFYAGSRPSAPVINRMSNPGLHYQHFFNLGDTPDLKLTSLIFGLEHRSDGQTTEVKQAADAALAQAAYSDKNHAFFDGISRGSNYLSAIANFASKDDDTSWEWAGKIKGYLTQDSAITWGPLAHTGTRVADYDLVTLQARFGFGLCPPLHCGGSDRKHEIGIEWTLGARGFKTDSVNIDFTRHQKFGPFDIPLYVRYHVGPMFTLSNYTQFYQSLGIGIVFATY